MPKTRGLFIRYLGAGFIATLTHLVIFACLLPWRGPTFSTFCAGATGAGIAYCLNRAWVFVERRGIGFRFAVCATTQVATSTLIVGLLAHWGMHAYLAQITAMAVVTVQGFMINHYWVFNHDIKRTPRR